MMVRILIISILSDDTVSSVTFQTCFSLKQIVPSAKSLLPVIMEPVSSLLERDKRLTGRLLAIKS